MSFKKLLICTSLMVTSVCFAKEESREDFIRKVLAPLQEKIDRFEQIYQEKCSLNEDDKEQECEPCNELKELIGVMREIRKMEERNLGEWYEEAKRNPEGYVGEVMLPAHFAIWKKQFNDCVEALNDEVFEEAAQIIDEAQKAS